MKKLVPLIVAVICLTGCDKWRPKEYPDPVKVLPTSVWELEEHLQIPSSELEPDCRLPKYMVYNSNFTGYYYYEHPCDSPAKDTIKFKWKYSKGNARLYQEITSVPYLSMLAEFRFIICDYDMVRLTSYTKFFSHNGDTHYILDGNYRPVKQ